MPKVGDIFTFDTHDRVKSRLHRERLVHMLAYIPHVLLEDNIRWHMLACCPIVIPAAADMFTDS